MSEQSEDSTLFVQGLCLGAQSNFWTDVNAIVIGMKPIYSIIRLADKEGCTLDFLYEFIDRITEALEKFAAANQRLIQERVEALTTKLMKRWYWFHKPIYAVSHILHPLSDMKSNTNLKS